MLNCIFNAHCLEDVCDKSCPILAETSYLLERNGITMRSPVFDAKNTKLKNAAKNVEKFTGKSAVVTSLDTVTDAELLTFCAICKNWKGSRLHCNVYNLKLSKYLEDTRQSWSSKSTSDSLEYARIWSESAKVLIISNLDYINFGDFEAQTLLNILQARRDIGKTTIIVTPPLDQLVGKPNSLFFSRMYSVLSGMAAESKKVVASK